MEEPQSPEKPDEPEGPHEPEEPQGPETPGRPIGGAAPEDDFRPTHNTRTWRACCLAPSIAIFAIFILTALAYMFSGQTNLLRRNQPSLNSETAARREAFIEFGRDYFGVSQEADAQSQTAFQEMDQMAKGGGSLERVHDAFARAGAENEKAARDFKRLEIPQVLASRDKIRRSADVMSESYMARSRACEIISRWNGDPNDRDTIQEYSSEAEKINQFTREGLSLLGEAASDNGLEQDDLRRIVPAEMIKGWKIGSMAFGVKKP